MGSPHHLGVNQLDAMSIPELHEQETDSAEEWIRPGANHSFGTKQGHKHTWLQALFSSPPPERGAKTWPSLKRGIQLSNLIQF